MANKQIWPLVQLSLVLRTPKDVLDPLDRDREKPRRLGFGFACFRADEAL